MHVGAGTRPEDLNLAYTRNERVTNCSIMDGVPGCRCFFRIAHSKKSADSLFVDHFQGFDYRWTEGLETSISPLAKIVIEGIVPDFSRSRNRKRQFDRAGIFRKSARVR